MRQTILVVALLAFAAHGAAAVAAFPGAEGGGAAAVGGRGGRVIEVTSLADSGPGTLRDAVQQSGPRTIVFRVAGVITLGDKIQIDDPYVTIAGQTAPGSGITLTFAQGMSQEIDLIRGMTHDIVIRYLRFRPGRGGVDVRSRGGVSFLGDCWNCVVDHCSCEWALYDNMGTWSNLGIQHDITFQWCIGAEGLALHSKGFNTGSDSQANGAQMLDIDLHHVLFMSNSNRNPLLRDKRTRLVNALIYNSSYGDVTISGGMNADVIGCKIVRGPSFDGYDTHEIQWERTGEPDAQPGNPSIYLAGNLGPHNPGDLGFDDWLMMNVVAAGEYHSDSGLVDRAFQRASPLPTEPFPITVDSAADLDAKLLPTVGASRRLDGGGHWVDARDAVDARLIGEYRTGGGQIPASEQDVGGFPPVDPGTPYVDSDHDGMPDAYELAHGLDPSDPSDGPRLAADGYTNLEHFLDGDDATTPPTRAPYGGTPWPIPGTIQAEDFDEGGEGVAYHDSDPTNDGGGYRATGVDIRACVDSGGGWQVGWFGAGEWLEYTTNVASAGSYDIAVRVANGAAGGTVHVSIDGADATGPLSFGATGGWDTWTTLVKAQAPLTAGAHIVRLTCDAGALDCNWLAFTPSTTSTPIVSGQWYKLTAKHSGMCLDVYAAGTGDGVNVDQAIDDGTAAQQWRIDAVGDGSYTLTARCSGEVLDVAGASLADGANVQQWPLNGGANQHWIFADVGGGFYEVANANSGKVLDVAGISLAAGANVQQWTWWGGDNQRWSLTPVATDPPLPPAPPTGVWQNRAFPARTTAFTATFRAAPGAGTIDGLVGLSPGTAVSATGCAAIVRFADTGVIDVRDGGAYRADARVPYAAGAVYRFRLVVDPAAHRYDAYVTPPGGAEIRLAAGCAFRLEQASASSLGDLADVAFSGTLAVSDPVIADATPAGPATTSTSAPSADAGIGVASAGDGGGHRGCGHGAAAGLIAIGLALALRAHRGR